MTVFFFELLGYHNTNKERKSLGVKELVPIKNYIITIARGFGSGGKNIGNILSEKLGIPCYDNQILAMASDYSGINKDLFFQVDEKLRGHYVMKRLTKVKNTNHIVAPTEKNFVSDENLFNIQSQMLRELANSQSCIIIGKCANHVLEEYDNVISVYVEAPRSACVKSLMNVLGATEEEAHKMITKTDKYRSDYYKYYTGGRSWTDPVAYDLTLNSARIGRERCADLIIEYGKLKFGKEVMEPKSK